MLTFRQPSSAALPYIYSFTTSRLQLSLSRQSYCHGVCFWHGSDWRLMTLGYKARKEARTRTIPSESCPKWRLHWALAVVLAKAALADLTSWMAPNSSSVDGQMEAQNKINSAMTLHMTSKSWSCLWSYSPSCTRFAALLQSSLFWLGRCNCSCAPAVLSTPQRFE